jgi:hypothetical protein
MATGAEEGRTVELSVGGGAGSFGTAVDVGAARGDTAPGDTALGGNLRCGGALATLVGAGEREDGFSVLRWADSTANRCAAGRVLRYPAAYTVRTAAELKATRLFAIFWLEPLLFLGVIFRRL